VEARLLKAHRAAYSTIKSKLPDAQVGVGLRRAHFQARNPHRVWDARAVHRESNRLNDRFLRSLFDTSATDRCADFIGVTWYGSHEVYWDWRAFRRMFVRYKQSGRYSLKCIPDAQACEISLPDLQQYGLPIYILGNGSDSDNVPDQCTYLLNHLDVLNRFLASGMDIRGYVYYSLLDGFEWERGYSSRRGLFHVDPERLTRTPKPVALIYKELIASGAVRSSTLDQFCPEDATELSEPVS
jgi:beta-glucosidase